MTNALNRLHQPEPKVRRLQTQVEGRLTAFISPKIGVKARGEAAARVAKILCRLQFNPATSARFLCNLMNAALLYGSRRVPSLLSKLKAALINAKWVNACGKLPRASPWDPVCSA